MMMSSDSSDDEDMPTLMNSSKLFMKEEEESRKSKFEIKESIVSHLHSRRTITLYNKNAYEIEQKQKERDKKK
jgi:hypothetical protein